MLDIYVQTSTMIHMNKTTTLKATSRIIKFLSTHIGEEVTVYMFGGGKYTTTITETGIYAVRKFNQPAEKLNVHGIAALYYKRETA